ncbi:hypothetical protein LCGC14_0784180 [marine sediment metagenome]|uniref:Uncharacterized protein n=1 Tax=marine sediment metagenome TaxID=412755 RepID=A0A0F9SEH4_9ZZZZ
MKSKSILLISLTLIIIIGVFVIAQQGEEPEVVENVTYVNYQTNVYNLGNNTFAQTSYLGFVNYYNGSEFFPINTTIVDSSNPLYDYEVIKGVYQSYFKEDPTEGPIIKFMIGSEYMTFQPMALQYEGYDGGLEQISMIQNVVGMPNDNKFLYEDAYGLGIDLQYSYYNDFLKENLIINQSSDLPSPPQYMIDQGNITLNLDFVLETNSNHIVIEGVEWDKKSDRTTSDEVYIKDEFGDVLYYFKKPYAYDSNRSFQLLTYQFKKQGNSLYVTIKTSFSWLNDSKRVYPIYIDPSQGPRNPATAVNVPGAYPDWFYTTNVFASDNSRAEQELTIDDTFGDPLLATNFGFTIPTGATIDGVKVEIERCEESDEPGESLFYEIYLIKAGSPTGTYKVGTPFNTACASEIYESHGGSSDMWAATLTPAEVNAVTFGMRVALSNEELPDEGQSITYIDHIRMTVYYTAAATNLQVNIADSWKTVSEIKINIGDSWKTVTQIKINIGDSWKTVYG